MSFSIVKLNAQTKIVCSMFFILFTQNTLHAQVGIGTTTPKAALDVTSTQYGLLMPRIALTATNVAAPVKNPVTGDNVLEVGTMVFNTGSTTGTYSVTPGPYFWDGTTWISLFQRKFQKTFKQSTDLVVDAGTPGNVNYTNIPGLNNVTFTAPYAGNYQITLYTYLGMSDVNTLYSDTSLCGGEGIFQLKITSTTSYPVATPLTQDSYSHAESYNINSATNTYIEMFNQVTQSINIKLNAGETCTLNVAFDPSTQRNCESNGGSIKHFVVGKTGTGALGNTCFIDAVYIGRD